MQMEKGSQKKNLGTHVIVFLGMGPIFCSLKKTHFLFHNL